MTLRAFFSLLIVLALGVPSGAAAGDSPSPPTVAGSTRLTGSTSAAIRVMLPKEAELDLSLSGPGNAPPSVEVSGSAPFAGVVIHRDGNPADGFLVGRYFGAVLADEDPYTVWPLGDGTMPPDGPVDLPAGTYWLQLIASDASEVTIRFGGLEGSTDLTPDTPTSTLIVPLSSRSPVGIDSVYWAGTSRTLSGPGFALVVQATTFSSPATNGVWGDCLYQREPPPEDVAYLPGCPGQDPTGDDSRYVVASHGGEWQRYQVINRELQPGVYGLGIWNEAATVVEDSAALGLWVSLAGS